MLSAYELERAKNIEDNQKVLKKLGLDNCVLPPPPPTRTKKKRSTSSSLTEPSRKSTRLSIAGDGSSASVHAAAEKLSDITPWEHRVFMECEGRLGHADSTSGPNAVWDALKHHQHLTRSASGKSIATTGVAGYGAALAKRIGPSCLRWAVRAVRLGVGGFAVGLVKRSMKAPYKSIGRSEHAIAVYHSSGQLEGDGKEARSFGAEYGAGDVIEVVLRPAAKRAHDVVFLLNGAEVGIAARGVPGLPDGALLAVQPYMGGVALLER